MTFKRYDSAMAVKATDRGPLPVGTVADVPLPVPDGWVLCDGREVPFGTYPGLEDVLRSARYPYGETPTGFRVPDVRGRAYT